MSSSSSMAKVLANGERLRTGCSTQSVATLIGQLESIRRRKEAGEDPATAELDAFMAKWFDAAISAWGKEDAFAETLGVSRQHVAQMRRGEKSAPLRALIPLLQSQEAVLAFLRPFCEAVDLEPPQPRRRVSREQIAELVISLVTQNPAFLRLVSEEAALRHGAQPEEVIAAIRGGQ